MAQLGWLVPARQLTCACIWSAWRSRAQAEGEIPDGEVRLWAVRGSAARCARVSARVCVLACVHRYVHVRTCVDAARRNGADGCARWREGAGDRLWLGVPEQKGDTTIEQRSTTVIVGRDTCKRMGYDSKVDIIGDDETRGRAVRHEFTTSTPGLIHDTTRRPGTTTRGNGGAHLGATGTAVME